MSNAPSTRHKRAGSESYYEDVDPRFAVEEPSDDGFRESGALPNALTPGGMQPGSITGLPGGYPATPGAQQAYQQRMNPDYLHPTYTGGPAGAGANDSHSSDNDVSLDPQHASGGSFDGASERTSEASHFTSISERPVNPNWRPPPGSVGSGPAEPRRQQDMLLAGNPDFSIPGMRGGRGRAGTGPVAASAVGGPSGGLTGAGRYPTEI
jgi:hypothetical protein